MDFPGGQCGHRMTLKQTLGGTMPKEDRFSRVRVSSESGDLENNCLCNRAGHRKHFHTVSVFPGIVVHKQSNWRSGEADWFPSTAPVSLLASLSKPKTFKVVFL